MDDEIDQADEAAGEKLAPHAAQALPCNGAELQRILAAKSNRSNVTSAPRGRRKPWLAMARTRPAETATATASFHRRRTRRARSCVRSCGGTTRKIPA